MLMKDMLMCGEQHKDYRREAERDRLIQEATAVRPKGGSLLAKVMARLSRPAVTPHARPLRHAGAKP